MDCEHFGAFGFNIQIRNIVVFLYLFDEYETSLHLFNWFSEMLC